jgi:hypothetical protein
MPGRRQAQAVGMSTSMIMHVACATLWVVSSPCSISGDPQVLGGASNADLQARRSFLLHAYLLQGPSQTWLMHWTGTLK